MSSENIFSYNFLPTKMPKKDRLESTIKIIGILLTSIAIVFTFLTFRANQKWERAKFTTARINEFSESKSVKMVQKILDYNNANIPLYKENEMESIHDDLVYEALVIDTIRGDFSENESKIREVFDDYFDKLSVFNRYIKSGVIEYEDVKPFLEYQIRILADIKNQRKSEEYKKRVWTYINYYGFHDIEELFLKFGYSIQN
ncbi:hypothetical protein [Pedobacter rhodius]|uniref:Uncharacterized protein n=1 Tax=Pedobacter rhodius TaxID=3004098 RepID=A0ABT4KSX9_9SPHI|nr:hypothetical protein [Pedobacter sp. SJ11]MCZ4221939.1 hypothetical protein [Pedobacter sp. SJ11]